MAFVAPKRHRRVAMVAIILLIAIGLLGYAGHYIWQWRQATHNGTVTIPQETITYSTDQPDETPPDEACDRYTVPADQPRYIKIDGYDISGCIQKVGLDQHGAVAVPSNVHVAGWFTGGPVPGQSGVSLIDGHVMGRFGRAIFSDLQLIKAGDTISVQYGDQSWKTFTVQDSHAYAVADTDAHLFDALDGVSKQLNIVTCYGGYDHNTQQYDKRLIVRAVLD